MNRLSRIAGSAVVVVGIVALAGESGAQVRSTPTADMGLRPMAAAVHGSLEGIVMDDRGAPVSGATISAIGPANAMAIADMQGRFNVRSLPPGPYLVRAHLVGYTPSARQFIDVRPAVRTTVSVAMHRTDGAKLLAAGFVGGDTAGTDRDPKTAGADDGEDRTELAWRLRHLKRSVLKDTTEPIRLAGADDLAGLHDEIIPPRGFGGLARAVGSSARFASTLFGSLSLSGEFNLLTTGSFDNPLDLFTTDELARAVAYVSLHGVAGTRGNWSAQAMMTQGTLGSWVVGGSFEPRQPATHLYELGVSYSAQRYFAGTGSVSLPSSEGSRSAGTLYAVDRWVLSPRVTLSYGGRYSKYDYLSGVGLLSPGVGISLVPVARTRILATVSRKMTAPGGEEFMQPLAAGLWVPPARTFESLSADRRFLPESALHYEVGFERDLSDKYVLIVSGFHQRVGDQQVALFSDPAEDSTRTSHYYIGRAGNFDASGLSVGMSNSLGRHLRGSVTYEYAVARWLSPGDSALVALLAPSVTRGPMERFSDLSTSVETDIPLTSTRVVVLYKVNTAFSRRDGDNARPGLDGRFDVQITQRLPFLDFTSAEWQVLVAVRNMFRDPSQFNSVYDELLVIRPPKRIVGGVLVRF
jgi:hypothetical protein